MIYFTSDLHFVHKNIAGPKVSRWNKGYRNFETVHDMNKAILASINDTVKSSDTLYILGDLAFSDPFYLLDRINCGNIIVIFGNHDNRDLIKQHSKVKETHEFLERNFNGQMFVMCHYPLRQWNKCHHGSMHLYGHCHHTIPDLNRSMDIGWCKYRRPLSINEVIAMLEPKDYTDHHD